MAFQAVWKVNGTTSCSLALIFLCFSSLLPYICVWTHSVLWKVQMTFRVSRDSCGRLRQHLKFLKHDLIALVPGVMLTSHSKSIVIHSWLPASGGHQVTQLLWHSLTWRLEPHRVYLSGRTDWWGVAKVTRDLFISVVSSLSEMIWFYIIFLCNTSSFRRQLKHFWIGASFTNDLGFSGTD